MVKGSHSGFRASLGRDEGFSLTELIVVLVLLGVILAVSYGGLQAIQAGNRVSDRQARFAQEIASPQAALEEMITQAQSIEAPGPYAITVLINRDNDNLLERHTFTVSAAGVVREQEWSTNDARQNVELVDDRTWSTNNVNQTNAVPAFSYRDENDVAITNMALVTDEVKSIVVTLVIEVEGREMTSSRRIYLRNF